MSLPMLFVHGWGQSARTWHSQQAHFGARSEVKAVNLPGHGGAADLPLEAWEEALLAELPATPAVLVGWSLGGMLALRLAQRHPDRLAGLVLLSTTPCFRQREGWEHACSNELFAQFELSLEADSPRLLNRFFALMLQGDGLERSVYLDLVQRAVDRRRPASMPGLRAGLQCLAELDLRDLLDGIRVPALIVHGEYDVIIPVGAAHYMAGHIPGSVKHILHAGHAPHLTRAEEFNEIVERWCQTHISTHAR